jgi:F-type H+-transporting ATPase subunit epsilon
VADKLNVRVVSPERELWGGDAEMVVAKTPDGEVGMLRGFPPLFGVLVDGAVVRINGTDDGDIAVAVRGGFVSAADDQIKILAEWAQLGSEVDVSAARAVMERAVAAHDGSEESGEDAKLARAQLRAAGEDA